ncbi:MAG TPA: glycosyltransferase 87 family protein, partial [Chloroflexia bacterium]
MESSILQSTPAIGIDTQAPHVPSGMRLLRMVAIATCAALLLVYLLGWYAAIRDPQMHGFDGVVRRSDFLSNLTGAKLIAEGRGQSLYKLDAQREAQNAVLAPYFKLDPDKILPYNHIPFEAMLTAPLVQAGVPYTAIFTLWELLMLGLLAASIWTMQRMLPVHGAALFVMVLAAVSYQPVARSFILGQNSPMVLLGICLVYAASRQKQDVWVGLALLLVAPKPQVLPVIGLVLLLQGRWRGLLVFGGAFGALCVAAMPVLGAEWPLQYARLLVGVAGWQDTGAIDPGIMHNWRGLATNLFGAWAPGLVTPLFLLLTLLSVGLLVWLWLRTRDTAPADSATHLARFDKLWAVAGILAVLTSLHLNPHDLVLLIFPAWILGAYALSGAFGSASRKWLGLLWLGYALIPFAFFLQEAPGVRAGGVVLSVLLMAGAALWLARQEGDRTARVAGMP